MCFEQLLKLAGTLLEGWITDENNKYFKSRESTRPISQAEVWIRGFIKMEEVWEELTNQFLTNIKFPFASRMHRRN